MTNDVAKAIERLQNRYLELTENGHIDYYVEQKYERALDYLVRNPHLTGSPTILERHALGNARKQLWRLRDENRKAQGVTVLSDEKISEVQAGNPALHTDMAEVQTRVELEEFVVTAPLSERERKVLGLLLTGKVAEDVAHETGVSLKVARVHISRARDKGWVLWHAA